MKQFAELEQRYAELAPMVSARCQAKEEQLAEQFARLSASLLAS
jgi:hypothetical protein